MSTQKSMNRREFLKLSGTAVGAAIAATACQPVVLPATPAPESAVGEMEAPAVLEGASIVFMRGNWYVPELNDILRDFAIDWATQNKVKFEFERVATADVTSRVASIIETKSGPNLAYLTYSPTSIADSCVDVSDIADELGDEYEGWYLPAEYHFRAGDKWLGIPIGAHTIMSVYREDWFEEAGYETLPETWEEMLEAGKALNSAGHPLGYAMTGSAPYDGLAHALILLWSFGGQEFNPDGSVALDSQETMDALEFAIEFYNEACDPGVTAYTDASNNQAFLAEQISFALNVNTIYLPARENQPELAAVMNHAMPPKGRAGSFTYQSVPGIVLFNHTEGIDRDAAKQFLRDFYSVGQYADFIKEGEGYLVPVGRVFENLPIWPDDPKLAITREVAKIGRPDGFELPSRSRLSGLMQERVTIGKMFSEACSSGDARAALDAALKEIDELKAQVGEG